MPVTNIVITCNLSVAVYLPLVARRYPWTEWNRKRFAALTLRFNTPRTTCLIFASGRIVCTGACTMDAARLSVLQTCDMIIKCGYPRARVNDFAVQNIASAYRFRRECLDLEVLFRAHPAQTSYEPELFPALVFRPEPTGTVFLVFESGRVVITGSRSVEECSAAQAVIDDVLVGCYCKKRTFGGSSTCS